MVLEALVQAAANTRVVLGRVNETEGLVRLELNSVNVANTGTAVYVDLVLANGTKIRTYCSKAVSAGLRSKEIVKDNLYGFPIVKGQTKDGVDIYRIEMPEGAASGHIISIDVSTLTVKDYVPTAIPFEELIG